VVRGTQLRAYKIEERITREVFEGVDILVVQAKTYKRKI